MSQPPIVIIKPSSKQAPYISGSIMILFGALALVAFLLLPSPLNGDAAIFLLIAGLVTAAIPSIGFLFRRATTTYVIGDGLVVFKHVFLTSTEEKAEMRAIKDAKVSQSVVQRFLKLGDVRIEISAWRGTDVLLNIEEPEKVASLLVTSQDLL
jgi:uncharacterized membrane protein YdbT with pleckstrin-like domain